MKRISIVFVVVGVLVLIIGVIFSSSNGKNNQNKKPEELQEKVITLDEIDEYMKKTDVYVQYENFFVITTKVEKNQYTIEYKNKAKEYITDTGIILFTLKDNVLSTEIESNNLLYINQTFATELLKVVCRIRGMEDDLIDRSLSLLGSTDSSLDVNNYSYSNTYEKITYKIRLDKSLVFPNLDNISLTKEDFEEYRFVLDDKNSVGRIQKGNVILYFKNKTKSYYIYEYNSSGNNTYNSLINLVEFYYGSEEAESLKKQMPSLKEGNYGKVSINLDYELLDNELTLSTKEKKLYETNYSLVKIELK